MISEIQRMEWKESKERLTIAMQDATKSFAMLSLLLRGVKVDAEDVDILNAEIIE